MSKAKKEFITAVRVAIILLLVFGIIPKNAKAAVVPGCRDDRGWSGSCVQQTPYLDKTTASANGVDKVRFWIQQSFSNGPNIFYKISVEGAGVSLSKDKIYEIQSGNPTIYDSVYITSTVPGNKYIKFYATGVEDSPPEAQYVITLTTPINFVDPNSVNVPAQPSLNSSSNTVASVPVIPSAPSVDKVKIGSIDVDSTKITEEKIAKNKKLKFSGKTTPNSTVTLYFQSDPFEDTTISDEEGNWTYKLTKDLGEGEHSLQVTVTDPATGQTSDKSEPIKFILVANDIQKINPTDSSESFLYQYLYYIVGITSILLLVVLVVLFYIKKKKYPKVSKTNNS